MPDAWIGADDRRKGLLGWPEQRSFTLLSPGCWEGSIACKLAGHFALLAVSLHPRGNQSDAMPPLGSGGVSYVYVASAQVESQGVLKYRTRRDSDCSTIFSTTLHGRG